MARFIRAIRRSEAPDVAPLAGDTCVGARLKLTSWPVTEFPARPSLERFNLLGRLALLTLLSRLDLGFGCRRAVPEAERLIACFHDVAMMRQPIQQRCRHLGITKYTRPFSEGQVRRDRRHAERFTQRGASTAPLRFNLHSTHANALV